MSETAHVWRDVASDPMDGAAVSHRQVALHAARRPPVASRTEYLRELARGRRVLDVGVVDHDLHSSRSGNWLHGHLAEVAEQIVGVDVIPDAVERLRAAGYDVRLMDITAGEYPEGTFDLIVAGEVIEHLGNVGGLFTAASALLADDGLMVVTTPNPYAMWRVWQNLTGRVHENVDHVTLLSAWGIAELAERAGLRLVGVTPIRTTLAGRKASWAGRVVAMSRGRLVPEAVCESIAYEIARP